MSIASTRPTITRMESPMTSVGDGGVTVAMASSTPGARLDSTASATEREDVKIVRKGARRPLPFVSVLRYGQAGRTSSLDGGPGITRPRQVIGGRGVLVGAPFFVAA